MSDNIYYGRPVRAVRFDGENLTELTGLLPHSRAVVELIARTDGKRGMGKAARVWTVDRSTYVPVGYWLVVAQDGIFWNVSAEEFTRDYVWSGELSGPAFGPDAFVGHD